LDHARSAVQSTAGGLEATVLPSHVLRSIAAVGEREGATLFMTLLAAYSALLSRYTGQNDIVVGTPVANRNRLELEPLIGLFMNVLAIRTRTHGRPSFRELIGRVRDSARAAYANQDAPFGKVVEMLRPQRETAYSPVVQAMFILQNTPSSESQPGCFQIEPVPLERRSAKNDLSLYAEEVPEGLSLAFEYNASLFERATIQRMLRGLEEFLRAAAEASNTPIDELPVMAESDRRVIVQDWNSTARPDDSFSAIHHLTSAQALRTPDAAAIRFRGEVLSYRELELKSNQLAAYLRKQGARTGALIAICMERSLDMLVAILGVLKTGAAYVPLDPEYPAQRIGWAVEDSGALLLLTQSSIRSRIPQSTAEVIEIDTVRLENRPATAPSVLVDPADLAYVIFTSGSTGRPKGVQVTHGGVVNFLRSMAVEPGLTSEDVLAALTTISFDIAGLELLLPLTVGARIELISHEEARDGVRLAECLESSRATCVQATPATWRMLIEAGWRGRHPLKVLCGGEPLPSDLASALLSRCSELWNMYGPTETTIWSTVERVESGFGVPIPIGWPIANTECYILDTNLDLAPAGVAGDLYIGGSGVARGYLNQPALTAEKFIPDPFRRDGSRLYRTGDLGRRRHDGTLECLGRTDHQVKIRGFRIELGEIEEALQLHSSVSRAAVVAADSQSGEKRLI
ncbi:MAG: amino acid adenylation domain-containing protein, partial [Acidobacteriaceae bacterium]|nr:amino acid adenylation domain-containing protein [Acidobacteriaceae bacterium]